MTEKETLDMYVANCQICTLANAMKNCPICKFNVGLKIKLEVKENDHRTNTQED